MVFLLLGNKKKKKGKSAPQAPTAPVKQQWTFHATMGNKMAALWFWREGQEGWESLGVDSKEQAD